MKTKYQKMVEETAAEIAAKSVTYGLSLNFRLTEYLGDLRLRASARPNDEFMAAWASNSAEMKANGWVLTADQGGPLVVRMVDFNEANRIVIAATTPAPAPAKVPGTVLFRRDFHAAPADVAAATESKIDVGSTFAAREVGQIWANKKGQSFEVLAAGQGWYLAKKI